MRPILPPSCTIATFCWWAFGRVGSLALVGLGMMLAGTGWAQMPAPALNPNTAELRAEAEQHAQWGEPAKALQVLAQVPSHDPAYDEVLAQAAQAAEQAEAYPAADSLWRQLLARPNPYALWGRLRLAQLQWTIGQDSLAWQWIQDARQRFPLDHRPPSLAGTWLTEAAQKDAAGPTASDATAQARLRQRAVNELAQALARNPYDYRTHRRLGDAYLAQGRLAPALLAWQTALVLAPLNDAAPPGGPATHQELLQLQLKLEALATKPAKAMPAGWRPGNALGKQLARGHALRRRYRTIYPVDAGLLRQTDLLFSRLGADAVAEQDTTPWGRFYAPLYRELVLQGWAVHHGAALYRTQPDEALQAWRDSLSPTLGAYAQALRAALAHARQRLTQHLADTVLQGLAYDSLGWLAQRQRSDDDGRLHTEAFAPSGVRVGLAVHNPTTGQLLQAQAFAPSGALVAETLALAQGGLQQVTTYYPYREDATGPGGRAVLARYTQHTDGTPQGSYRAHHPPPHSTLMAAGKYEDGRPIGPWLQLYPDGHPQLLVPYPAANQPPAQGPLWHRHWHPNGALADCTAYVLGQPDGPTWVADAAGRLQETGTYQRGARHGTWTLYDAQGRPREAKAYHRGVAAGRFQRWGAQGQLAEDAHYQAGQLDGRRQVWDEDGHLHLDERYDQGRLLGWAVLDDTGATLAQGEASPAWTTYQVPDPLLGGRLDGQLHDGVRYGGWRQWYVPGEPRSVHVYEAGRLYHEAVDYAPSGQPALRAHYQADTLHGLRQRYWPNGQLRQAGHYHMGQRTGTWVTHYPDGALALTAHYRQDTPVGCWTHHYVDGTPWVRSCYEGGHPARLWVRPPQATNWAQAPEAQAWDAPPMPAHWPGQRVDRTTLPDTLPAAVLQACQQLGLQPPEPFRRQRRYHYPNGKVELEASWREGRLDGPWAHNHYPSGDLAERGTYTLGQPDGTWRGRYPTGQTRYLGNYVLGLRQGPWTQWGPWGLHRDDATWHQDQRHGPGRLWIDSTAPLVLETWQHGRLVELALLHGADTLRTPIPLRLRRVELQDPLGRTRLTARLANGTWHGPRILYYPGGDTARVERFVNGAPHGDQRWLGPGGEIISAARYHNGSPHGPQHLYDPNGKLAEAANFLNGQRQGETTLYQGTGRALWRLVYQNGRLVQANAVP